MCDVCVMCDVFVCDVFVCVCVGCVGWGGVWCVVCGVWCVVCGVWCVVCGVWCVVCGVWCVVWVCVCVCVCVCVRMRLPVRVRVCVCVAEGVGRRVAKTTFGRMTWGKISKRVSLTSLQYSKRNTINTKLMATFLCHMSKTYRLWPFACPPITLAPLCSMGPRRRSRVPRLHFSRCSGAADACLQ